MLLYSTAARWIPSCTSDDVYERSQSNVISGVYKLQVTYWYGSSFYAAFGLSERKQAEGAENIEKFEYFAHLRSPSSSGEGGWRECALDALEIPDVVVLDCSGLKLDTVVPFLFVCSFGSQE